jgi:hypothetical protein
MRMTSVQLYTLRDQMAQDRDGSLRRLAEIGSTRSSRSTRRPTRGVSARCSTTSGWA